MGFSEKLKSAFKGRFFNLFMYASFLFLVIGLARADYLNIPTIYDPLYLAISFPLMMLGFYWYSLSYAQSLDYGGTKITFRSHIAANGLVQFGKYIPGKLWGLIGRAAYSEKYDNIPMGQASILSFKNQLMVIWAGFLVGLTGSAIVLYDRWEVWLGVLVFLVITPLFFSQNLAKSFVWFSKKFFGKEFQLDPFDYAMVKKVMLTSILCWIGWSAGFYFLAQSLVEGHIDPLSGLSFALATNIGILAIIAPGGIGVREAAIVLYLNTVGLSIAEATTIAVASRLWFLAGEGGFFLSGIIANRFQKVPGKNI